MSRVDVLKEKGNKMYKQGLFKDAINLYSDGLVSLFL